MGNPDLGYGRIQKNAALRDVIAFLKVNPFAQFHFLGFTITPLRGRRTRSRTS